jgi:hypothetical protein
MRVESEEISVEEIRQLLPQLSRTQILELDREIHEYLETSMLMRGAQTALKEWDNPEEDIYEPVAENPLFSRFFYLQALEADKSHSLDETV